MNLADLPRGYRLAAGMGVATVLPDLDFETYSEAGFVWDDAGKKWTGPPGAPGHEKGLSVVGAANYTADPSCRVLSLAYDLKDGRGKRHWYPGMAPPQDLFDYLGSGGVIEAWNVSFERWVWKNVCIKRMGWPAVNFRQWRCAMAKARAFALPGKLALAGKVLNLDVQKDAEGTRLLKKFTMPRKPTKADPRLSIPLLWTAQAAVEYQRATGLKPSIVQEDHADSIAFGHYNVTDIAAEAELSARTPDLEGEELEWWIVDQKINERGVHVDMEGVSNCVTVVEQALERYNAELLQITGIDAASKVQQLLGWLHACGVHLNSLDEENVETALTRNLPPPARRALEIRAAVGSASVKKVFAMRNRATAEGRMHDLFIYYGARTGRATGEGPQPTNSPKAGPDLVRCGHFIKGKLVEGTGCGRHHGPHRTHCPWCGRFVMPRAPKGPDLRLHEWSIHAVEDALEVLRQRSLAWVEYVFGDAMHVIAGCIRGLYDAAPGHDLISTDYNSIEAVGLAMISGEKWRIEVFRTHGKIYEKSAAMMYGIPFEKFAEHREATGQHHPLRQKGKIGELAFGYQGWLGAAKAFDMPGTDDEIKSDILAWRAASPAVEWTWGGQTLGKAWGIWQNAVAPGYPGVVDASLAPIMARADDGRWDRTPYYFGVEGMAVQAMASPGVAYPVMRLDGTFSGIVFQQVDDILYCTIPSGRRLVYHRPRFEHSDRGGVGLSYEGYNTNPKNGPVGWIRMNTWGGRLVENINQATCRDILRFAAINLEARGYFTVLHVYDEIVSEIPEGFGTLEEFEAIVSVPPAWAHDWPIRAPGPWRAKRYRKG